MANDCTGTLKIRGKYKDILAMIENEISCSDPDYQITYEQLPYTICWHNPGVFFGFKNFHHAERAYFYDHFEAQFYDDISGLVIAYITDVICAWRIPVEQFRFLSKKYNLDFKMTGYESKGQFEHDMEIHKGEVIQSKFREYKNYLWECPHPELGG